MSWIAGTIFVGILWWLGAKLERILNNHEERISELERQSTVKDPLGESRDDYEITKLLTDKWEAEREAKKASKTVSKSHNSHYRT